MKRLLPVLLTNCALASITSLTSLTGCHGSEDPAASESVEPRAEPLVGSGEAPADVETLRALLKAHHAEDLPSAEQLARYPSAEASLRYLGEFGDTMAIRVRALALLEHFGSTTTGELLTRFVADATVHPALRAAALTGMRGQALDQQPQWLAVVVAALHDEDPRVGTAAVELLGRSAAGREALRQAALEGELPPAVREAIDARDGQ